MKKKTETLRGALQSSFVDKSAKKTSKGGRRRKAVMIVLMEWEGGSEETETEEKEIGIKKKERSF